jgi:hypothetical protein
MTQQAGSNAARESGAPIALTLLVTVLFLMLSFSTDIIEAIAATADADWVDDHPDFARILTLPVDALLIGFAASLAPTARKTAALPKQMHRGSVLLGAAATLLIDGVAIWAFGADPSVLAEVALSMLYLPPLYFLWSGLLGIDARRFGRPGKDMSPSEVSLTIRRSLTAATPLFIGVAAAYVGETLYWREILDEGRIDQEYFAQMSQVIPLLAVALGVESRFADSGRTLIRAEVAIGLFTILLLVVAEALAISALPVDNDKVQLFIWHEYIAFVLTLYAAFVALTLLTIVLAFSLRPGRGRSTA